jgi:hypothetical protein
LTALLAALAAGTVTLVVRATLVALLPTLALLLTGLLAWLLLVLLTRAFLALIAILVVRHGFFLPDSPFRALTAGQPHGSWRRKNLERTLMTDVSGAKAKERSYARCQRRHSPAEG